MTEIDMFTEEESRDFVCVPEICKGFCCENIDKEIAKNLSGLGLPMIAKADGQFRCDYHNEITGLCMHYEHRYIYCRMFFCPSASRGFMKRAKESMQIIKKG